jgi:hypothetical protein
VVQEHIVEEFLGDQVVDEITERQSELGGNLLEGLVRRANTVYFTSGLDSASTSPAASTANTSVEKFGSFAAISTMFLSPGLPGTTERASAMPAKAVRVTPMAAAAAMVFLIMMVTFRGDGGSNGGSGRSSVRRTAGLPLYGTQTSRG